MNKYDDFQPDIPGLLREQTARLPPCSPHARSAGGLGWISSVSTRSRFLFTGLLHKLGIYTRLVYSNLVLDWFFEFREYWVHELGNRNIAPHDFYFLMSSYRQKFQDLEIEDSTSSDGHLASWQDPRTVYLLFHNQYKLALRPLAAARFVKYIPRGGEICEYGCGLAPMTASLVRFFPQLNLRITCADIPTIVFHFARWKYRDRRYIDMLELDPGDDRPLTKFYDTIFCMTVLEHLPRPLLVVRHLHDRLKPGGFFIFDYIHSAGGGLDTAGSARERIEVLKYIRDHFRVVSGDVPLDGKNVGIVVCQKPSNT